MGSAVGITRCNHTASDLRNLAVKSANASQTRRRLALAMVLEGMKRADAARVAGMDRQTFDWVHRYNETGVAGLVSRLPPGLVPKLTAAQMAEL